MRKINSFIDVVALKRAVSLEIVGVHLTENFVDVDAIALASGAPSWTSGSPTFADRLPPFCWGLSLLW